LVPRRARCTARRPADRRHHREEKRARMRGESKVRVDHRARTAVIYVRQSTLAQVRDHTESTARQYALAGEASRLGWPAGGIEVIDTDLGVSGRSTEGRDGFKALVARVCLPRTARSTRTR
jgi:Resolvase, N terminal domain